MQLSGQGSQTGQEVIFISLDLFIYKGLDGTRMKIILLQNTL
jgi:hypothetical protein